MIIRNDGFDDCNGGGNTDGQVDGDDNGNDNTGGESDD